MNFAVGWLDIVIILIVLVSAGYAIWRGFVAEILGIVAWAAGAFATLYFGPWFARFVRTLMSPEWLADVVGYGFIFLVVVVPLSFMSHRFSEGVKSSPVSQLDRALGGAFGVVRGLAIAGLAYILFTWFVPISDHPRWLREAGMLPIIQGSAEVLLSLVPDQGIDLKPYASEPKDPIAAKIMETDGASETSATTVKSPITPKPKPIQASAGSNAAVQEKDEKGYGARDRQALDNLIEATGKSGR